jgi:hypothetical protein
MMHKIRPRDLANNCCTKKGGQEMLRNICSRDLASNAAPHTWPDNRNTQRFATRCCTRLGPEIWPTTSCKNKGGREMLHEICSRDQAGDSAPESGQTIAAQQGLPQDSAGRSGQQAAAPKRWPKDVAQDLLQRSGQQLLHHKFGQIIAAQAGGQ